MKIEHTQWQGSRWEPTVPGKLPAAQLVLLFGCPSLLKQRDLLQGIQQAYPSAHLLGCSTAGEISGTRVLDESLVATAVQFEQTALQGVRIKLQNGIRDFQAGALLAQELDKEGLVHVLVLSRGVNVNGSDLVCRLLPEKTNSPPCRSATATTAPSTPSTWNSSATALKSCTWATIAPPATSYGRPFRKTSAPSASPVTMAATSSISEKSS